MECRPPGRFAARVSQKRLEKDARIGWRTSFDYAHIALLRIAPIR